MRILTLGILVLVANHAMAVAPASSADRAEIQGFIDKARFIFFCFMEPIMLKIIAGVFLCLTVGVAAQAQTVVPNPDPGIPGEGYVDYLGRYGERLKLRGGWEIAPDMHGDVEVVNFYRGYRFVGGRLEKYKPAPVDIKAENFSRLGLIQLIVMPWNSSSAKTLEELKKAKEVELTASGVEFRIVDDPFPGYGHNGQKWPRGTFEALVATPYMLSQLYTTSGDQLVILTTGRDVPPSTVISSHYDGLRSSVREWVVPETGPRATALPGADLGPVRVPQEAGALAIRWSVAVVVVALFLLFGGRMSDFAATLLIYSHTGLILGCAAGLICMPFFWAHRNLGAPAAVPVLLLPFAAAEIEKRRKRTVVKMNVGLIAWAVFCLLVLYAFGYRNDAGERFAPFVPFDTAERSAIIYAVGGIIVGLGRVWRPLAAILLIAACATGASAQIGIPIGSPAPDEMPGTEGYMIRERLEQRGITRKSFDTQALGVAREKTTIYDYQRVEIKGIFSKEDTDDAYRDLFDKQVEPSSVGGPMESVIGRVPSWLKSTLQHAADLYHLSQDTYGEFTDVGKAAIRDLKDKEINEVVAHSWGTEILYNGIISGVIRPPRRIIAVGMPDRDLEKWKALSTHTGTEVVVYANSHDPAARAARILGGLTDRPLLSEEKLLRELADNRTGHAPTAFDAKWDAVCRTLDCNPHGRVAGPVTYDYAYRGPTHSRLEYYKAVLADGVIPYEKTDAKAMAAAQDEMIKAEGDRLYADAFEGVQAEVREERRKMLAIIEEVQQRQRDVLVPATARPIPLEPERIVGKEIVDPRTIQPVRGVSVPPEEFAMQRMGIVASKVCSNPAASIDSDLVEINWSAARTVRDIRPYTANMTDCERRIFQKLSDFAIAWYPGARITADEVRGTANGPAFYNGGGAPHQSPSHEPVWGKTGIRKPQ